MEETGQSFGFVYQGNIFGHNLSLHNKNKEICEENAVLMHLKLKYCHLPLSDYTF